MELGLYKVLQEDAANSAPALATLPLASCFGALSPTIEATPWRLPAAVYDYGRQYTVRPTGSCYC